jgi:hypothetical protein
MPVDQRARRLVSENLVRVHGEEVADAIMTLLPPTDCATKQDLEVLEARMGERLERAMRRQTFMVFVAILASPAISKLVDQYYGLFA